MRTQNIFNSKNGIPPQRHLPSRGATASGHNARKKRCVSAAAAKIHLDIECTHRSKRLFTVGLARCDTRTIFCDSLNQVSPIAHYPPLSAKIIPRESHFSHSPPISNLRERFERVTRHDFPSRSILLTDISPSVCHEHVSNSLRIQKFRDFDLEICPSDRAFGAAPIM